MKAILEITDEQLLDVVAFVKERNIPAVFEGALLLEVGKSYRNRKGEFVQIEEEKNCYFRGGGYWYFPNGKKERYIESPFDLIEEVKEELPFKMVVGGVYEMRNGGIEKIISEDEDDDYTSPFIGESGLRYTEDGTRSMIFKSPYDLIKRIR